MLGLGRTDEPRAPCAVRWGAERFAHRSLAVALLALCAWALAVGTAASAATVSFSYRSIIEGTARTLSATVQITNLASGSVSVTGVDSARPSSPFSFDWGDGTMSTGFFPQSHTYANASRNYVVGVTARYSDGTTDTVTLQLMFVPTTLGAYSTDPATRVTVPATVPPMQSVQPGFAVPTLSPFTEAELPGFISRTGLEQVFSIANEILRDLHNADTETAAGGGFPQVVLTDRNMPANAGGYSCWYTDPAALAVRPSTMAQNPVGWTTFFHELSHNVTLRSPRAYRTGGRVDGQGNAVFSESLARIFPAVVAYLLVNDAARYGLPVELADQIAAQARQDLRNIKTNTAGPIALWNNPATTTDETMAAFNVIAYQFFLNADPDGNNYRDALKRMMSRLACFNPEWERAYDAKTDSVSGARFRAALMIGSMSYGLQKDLRATFRELGFPIDDLFHTAVHNGQRSLTHIITSATDVKVTAGQSFTYQIAASGNPTSFAVQGLPAGLVCAAATGVISGSTSQKGTHSLKVTASSATGSSEVEMRLVVGDPEVAPTVNLSRLINLSILTSIATVGDSFTMGYVVGGGGTSGTKPLVIRAAGPSLGALGVADPLADPRLELFAGVVRAGENDNWGGSVALAGAMSAVGAFAYSGPASRDAAAALAVASGDNSVKVSAVGDGTGTVIAEIYDATPATSFTGTTPRLINVSVLKQLGTGFTLGFVVGGSGTKGVLVRAIGPTLDSAFGVSGAVGDPQLSLQSAQAVIAANDNWGGGSPLAAAFSSVGAFALPATSRDAAVVAGLNPGNYTVQVSGVGGATGTILVEIYEVP